MNIYSIIPVAIGIWFFAIGIFVLRKNRAPVNIAFALEATACSIWLFGYAAVYSVKDYNIALSLIKLLYVGVIFIPTCFYHFSIEFLQHIGLRLKRKWDIFIPYSLSGIFVILLFTTNHFITGTYHYFWGYYAKAGIIHTVFLFFFPFVWFFTIIRLYRSYKSVKNNSTLSTRAKYVFLAFLVGSPGMLDFIQNYGIEFYPFASIFVGAGVAIMAYAIVKYRVMDITLAFTKASIFLAVYFLAIWTPFWLFSVTKNAHLSLFVAIIMAMAGPIIHRRLQMKAEEALQKKQLQTRRALRELAETLPQVKETKKLLNEICEGAYEIIEPQFVGLYVYSADSKNYFINNSLFEQFDPLPRNFSENSPFLGKVLVKKNSLSLEEAKYHETNIADKLKTADDKESANLPPETFLIPFFRKKLLYAFLILGPKTGQAGYDQADIDIFEIISSQGSLALENCLFWEDERERLRQEEKQRRFEAMDHFSSSLAHEIGNPITGILGNVKEIRHTLEGIKAIVPPDHFQKFELADSQFSYVYDGVDRISKMIIAVKDFSKGDKGDFKVITMDEVIGMFLDIFEPQAHFDQVTFTKSLEQGIRIEGNKIYLVEVLINIGVNALHSVKFGADLEPGDDVEEHKRKMLEEKKVDFKMYRKNGDKVIIEIKDNGAGISKNLKEDIFIDFVTTKASTVGTGIGLSRSRKIVQMHNGKIWCESEGKYKGATFFVELPITDKPLPEKQSRGKRWFREEAS